MRSNATALWMLCWMPQQFPLKEAYVIDEARLDVMDGIFKRMDALGGARNQHISLFQRELLWMLCS